MSSEEQARPTKSLKSLVGNLHKGDMNMSNNTNSTKIEAMSASATNVDSVTILAEHAFVPDCTEEKPRQPELKLTDLDETAAKTAALMDVLRDINIAKGYYGDPKNGKHIVTLNSYEPVLKDGVLEYIRCEFRDRAENNIWVNNISIPKLEEKLTDLSYSNRGILGGRTEDAFAILQNSFFYVWTVIGKTKDGTRKVFTYFSEKRYEGACNFQQTQRQKEADKEAEYKARKAAIEDEEADAQK